MQFWNFALFGVTGDLAQRKILPALSKFAANYANDVAIDFIGYSRSQADEQKVLAILDENSPKDAHLLRSVSFVQGDYSDPGTIQKLIQSKPINRKFFIYLAVPPQVILEFFKGCGSLLDQSTYIIIEKPFGRNSKEGGEIIDLLREFSLLENVFFIDHYLFKSAVRMSQIEKSNFRELFIKPIKSIRVQALESLGVEDRKGYYDMTGAFKDMFIHLYSLTSTALNLLDKSISDFDFTPQKIKKGQYITYLTDIEEAASPADTYFEMVSSLKPHDHAGQKYQIEVIMESGKKVSQKRTHISVQFRDGSLLDWNIEPLRRISYQSGEEIRELASPYSSVSDHENMFKDLLTGEKDYFVGPENVVESWKIYDEAKKLPGFSKEPFIYQDCQFPLTKVSKSSKNKRKKKSQ